MRILVLPNTLDIGGSQLNAVELAEALQGRGHALTVMAPPGALLARLEAAGIEYVPAPEFPRLRPSPAIMRSMRAVVAARGIDVVHGYEWPPILEAFYGCRLVAGTPVVGTVMSMGVAPFIPSAVPLVVGTHQIAMAERSRRPVVHVLEPPVDTVANQPCLGFPSPRVDHGWSQEHVVVVVVSRLARELKREGILAAVEAVGRLSIDHPVRLAVVGDGPARAEVDQAAARVNAARGASVVAVVGAVDDPRAWYDDADIALGMGGSALRAMAFGKPLVVQGERGFWRVLDEESLRMFHEQGWYGVGDGGDGSVRVERLLRELIEQPRRRRDLGRLAREAVVDRYSLDSAADQQEQIYREVVDAAARERVVPFQLVTPAARFVSHECRRRAQRLRGRATEDDFNAISAQPRESRERTP